MDTTGSGYALMGDFVRRDRDGKKLLTVNPAGTDYRAEKSSWMIERGGEGKGKGFLRVYGVKGWSM